MSERWMVKLVPTQVRQIPYDLLALSLEQRTLPDSSHCLIYLDRFTAYKVAAATGGAVMREAATAELQLSA